MGRRKLLLGLVCLCLVGCSWEASVKTAVVKQVPKQLSILEAALRDSKNWPQGTVLVSRNRLESLNKSPGYQNHLGIYVGNGQVVESQEQGGVLLTPLAIYLARDYTWFQLYPHDQGAGERAAAKARTLVGLPYRQLSSLFRSDRREEKGLNCVSVVRVSYSDAMGKPLPELKKPDDILSMTSVFTQELPPYAKPVPPPKKEPAQKADNRSAESQLSLAA